MPISKQQVKAKPKAAPKKATVVKEGALTGYESIVDQLAELEAIITPEVKAALKKQDRFEKELRAIADKEVAAEAPAVFNGSTHDFTVTDKAEQRIVVVAEARKQMGDKLFFELAKILLGDVDKYLTADQQISCIVRSRTGSRKGTLVAK